MVQRNVQKPQEKSDENEVVFGRKDFVAIADTPVHKIFIESLNAYVYMKEIGALDQETYERELVEFVQDENGNTIIKHKADGMRLKYLVRVLCTEKGRRLFQDDEYAVLGDKPKDVITALHQKALEINKVTIDESELKEALEKNLNTVQSDDSHSD